MTAKDNSTLHVSVWLDRRTALLSIEERDMKSRDGTPKVTLERFKSGLERKSRATGGRHGHIAYQHQTVRPAIKEERRKEKDYLSYLHHLISRIEDSPQHRTMSSLKLAGPGETKKVLASELAKIHPEWPAPEISNTQSRLSEAQKLAHFTEAQRRAEERRKNRTNENPARRSKG